MPAVIEFARLRADYIDVGDLILWDGQERTVEEVVVGHVVSIWTTDCTFIQVAPRELIPCVPGWAEIHDGEQI